MSVALPKFAQALHLRRWNPMSSQPWREPTGKLKLHACVQLNLSQIKDPEAEPTDETPYACAHLVAQWAGTACLQPALDAVQMEHVAAAAPCNTEPRVVCITCGVCLQRGREPGQEHECLCGVP